MKRSMRGFQFLILSSLLLVGCEKMRVVGSAKVLAPQADVAPVDDTKFEITVAGSNGNFENGNGHVSGENSDTCGDGDVTNSARKAPELVFLGDDSKFNESHIQAGPSTVVGAWVASSNGLQTPGENFSAMGFVNGEFATKTISKPGKTLTQMNTVGDPSVKRDIAALISHGLNALTLSINNGYVIPSGKDKRIFVGLMTCNKFSGASSLTKAVPSTFHLMRFFNQNLPEALAKLDFSAIQIPPVLSYEFSYSKNSINLALGSDSSALNKDSSFDKKAIVAAAKDIKTALAYSNLNGDTLKLLSGIKDVLKNKKSCSAVASLLPAGEAALWSAPYFHDKGMDLGRACRILESQSSSSSFADLVDGLNAQFSSNRKLLSNRLMSAALFVDAARAIPEEWKKENDVRCHPDKGLYINQVFNSAVLPIGNSSGKFISTGKITGAAVSPEGNFASFVDNKTKYFDSHALSSGDLIGNMETIFNMFSITLTANSESDKNGNPLDPRGGTSSGSPGSKDDAGSGGLLSSPYGVFAGDLSKISAQVGVGDSVSPVTVDVLFPSQILIKFLNRALAVTPKGVSNSCTDISAAYCMMINDKQGGSL